MIVEKFAEAAHLFGLIISLGITEVLLQPAPASTVLPPSISIEGTQLKTIDSEVSSSAMVPWAEKSMPGLTIQARPMTICYCMY